MGLGYPVVEARARMRCSGRIGTLFGVVGV